MCAGVAGENLLLPLLALMRKRRGRVWFRFVSLVIPAPAYAGINSGGDPVIFRFVEKAGLDSRFRGNVSCGAGVV